MSLGVVSLIAAEPRHRRPPVLLILGAVTLIAVSFPSCASDPGAVAIVAPNLGVVSLLRYLPWSRHPPFL